jgi:Zn-dependent protease with chaperone function
MSPGNWLLALDEVGFTVMGALVSVLWQSSILLAGAGLLAFALRRRGPGARHAVWVAALLAVPLLPLLGLGVSKVGAPRAEVRVMPVYARATPAPAAPEPEAAPAGAVAHAAPAAAPAVPAPLPEPEPVSLLDCPWALALSAYALGAAALLGLVLVGWVRIRRWVLSARPVVDGPVRDAFERARTLTGVSRPVPVAESGRVPAPISVGVVQPVVLLPTGWAAALAPDELRAVAVHELAHVGRRDPLVLTLVSALRAVLFFHPLVWLAARRVAALAETACDEAVIEAGHHPVPYARMLSRLAEGLRGRSVAAELAAGVCLSRHAFLRRIQDILSTERGRLRRPTRLALAGTCFGITVSLGLALGLPLAERGAAAEAAGAPVAERPYAVALASGGAVELLGVGYHPSEDADWWRPDGSLLDRPPCPPQEGRSYAEGYDMREIVVGLDGPRAEGASVRWRVEDGAALGGSHTSPNGRPPFKLRVSAIGVPPLAKAVTVRVGVAAGPWTRLASSDGSGTKSVGTERGGLAFSPATEDMDGVHITVTDDMLDADHRIVAVGADGVVHTPWSSNASGPGGFRQTTVLFQDLFLHEVEEFRFEVRDYEWVEFRNVSVRPGHMTGVEVQLVPEDRQATERLTGEPPAADHKAFLEKHRDEIERAAQAFAAEHDGALPGSAQDVEPYLGEAATAELRPAVEQILTEARRKVLAERLYELGLAISLYQVNRGGAYPPDLETLEALGILDEKLDYFSPYGRRVEYVIRGSDDRNEALLYYWPPHAGGTWVLYQNLEMDWVEPAADGSLTNPRTGAVIRGPGTDEARRAALERLMREESPEALHELLRLNGTDPRGIQKMGAAGDALPREHEGSHKVTRIRSVGREYVVALAQRFEDGDRDRIGSLGAFFFDDVGRLVGALGGEVSQQQFVQLTTLGTPDRWFAGVISFADEREPFTQRTDVHLVQSGFPRAFRVYGFPNQWAWSNEPKPSPPFAYPHFFRPGDVPWGEKGIGRDGEEHDPMIGWPPGPRVYTDFIGPSRITYEGKPQFEVDLRASRFFEATDTGQPVPASEARERPKPRPAHPAPEPAGEAREGEVLERPGPAAAAPEELPMTQISGRVVDDETGEPVERFGLQSGFVKEGDPLDVTWGGGRSAGRRPGGRFSVRAGWGRGRRWHRVLADGYVPEPITPEPIASGAEATDLVVRLKRGRELRGRVLDHLGRSVVWADVLVAGYQPVQIEDGEVHHFDCSRAQTDEDGRFVLTGVGPGAEGVVVSTLDFEAWLAPLPPEGEELTITLPEPARLNITCDIPGDLPEQQVRLELKTWGMEGWKGVLQTWRTVSVPNGGAATAQGLTPGLYDVARMKMVRLGDRGQGTILERHDVALAAGEAAAAEFVRKVGQRVTGDVTGLEGTGVSGAFVFVRERGATGSAATDAKRFATFDATSCEVGGRFETALVEPGRYTVVAEAHKPSSPDDTRYLGRRGPGFVGRADVTVTEDGPAPHVVIEMRPRE